MAFNCESNICLPKDNLSHPPAQVVLFTAGLEDYAAPICDAIEARYPGAFHHRLYRPATVACEAYPCVKVNGLQRCGRDSDWHQCRL